MVHLICYNKYDKDIKLVSSSKIFKDKGDIMKFSNQKLKMLYIMKILLEKTDEEHTLTVPEIISELAKLGISAERRSIYDDIEYLKLFDIDICTKKSKTTGYFVANREFELPELKLLVDSVQSAKFITQKKSLELISKIEKLTSKENAKQLHRQVFVTNRVKTLNERIYYNIDKIYDAISTNKQIKFKYFDINISKEKVFRKNGEFYIQSPVSLTWNDENYYLITYNKKYDDYVHYRVDKMDCIELSDKERILSEKPFDLSVYTKTMFQMFGGEEVRVSMKFENELVGVIYDKFGIDIPIIKADDNHFICNVNVAVSTQFLSWIISFGSRAEILSPDSVVEQLYNLLKETRKVYEGVE